MATTAAQINVRLLAEGAQATVRDIRSVGDAVDQAGQQGAAAARSNAATWSTLGGPIAAFGAASAVAFSGGISAATNFQQAMSLVEAATNATGPALQQLNDLALDIGKNTSFGATEAAQAINELALAGVSVENILGGAAMAATDLAAAGEIALPQSAAIMSAALNQFGLQAGAASGAVDDAGESINNATRIADLFANAAAASSTGIAEIGESMKYVGTSASAMGYSVEDVTIALAAMAAAGVTGSQAGTGLNQALLAMAAPTQKAVDKMNELGVSFVGLDGSLRPMPDILADLTLATSHMGDAQRQAALDAIFGTQGGVAMNAMLLSQTDAAYANGMGWDQLAESVLNGSGAAAQAQIKLDNLSGSFEALKGSVETLLIMAFTPLLAGIRSGVDLATGFLDVIIGLPQPILTLAAALTGVGAAVGLLGGGILLVLPRILEVRAALTALGGISAITGGIGAAFVAALGPIALVAAAAGVLYLVWSTNLLGIRDLVEDTFGGIGTFIDTVQGAWNDLRGTTEDPIAPAFGGLTGTNPMIESLRTTREQAEAEARRFGRDVLGRSGEDLERYVANQVELYETATSQDEAYWRRQGQILGKSGPELDAWVARQVEANRKIGRFEGTFRSIGSAIRGINGGEIPGWLKGIAGIADGIGGLVPAYQKLVKGGLNPVRAGIQALGLQFPRLAGLTGRLDRAVVRVTRTWGDLTDRFRNFRDAGAGPVQAALGALGQTFPALGGVTQSLSRGVTALGETWGDLTDRVRFGIDTFKAFRDGGANPVVAVLGSLMAVFPGLQGVLGPAITNVQQFTDAFKAFRDGGANPVIAVLGGLMAAFPGLRDALGPIAGGVQRLTDAFGANGWAGVLAEVPNLIRNVVSGIGSLAVSLGGWVLEVAAPAVGGWLLDAVGNLLGWIGDRLPAAGTKLGELVGWVLAVAAPTVGGWLATAFSGMKQWVEDQLGIGGTSDEKMSGVGGNEITWSGWLLNVAAPGVAGWITGGASALSDWVKGKLGLGGGGDTGQGQPDAASVGGGRSFSFGSWVLDVALPTIGGWLKGGASAVAEFVRTFLPKAGQKLGELAGWILDVAIPTVGGWLATAFSTMRDLVQGFLPNGGWSLGEITSWVLNVGIPTVGGWLATAYNTIKELIQGFIPNAGQVLGEVTNWILNVFAPNQVSEAEAGAILAATDGEVDSLFSNYTYTLTGWTFNMNSPGEFTGGESVVGAFDRWMGSLEGMFTAQSVYLSGRGSGSWLSDQIGRWFNAQTDPNNWSTALNQAETAVDFLYQHTVGYLPDAMKIGGAGAGGVAVWFGGFFEGLTLDNIPQWRSFRDGSVRVVNEFWDDIEAASADNDTSFWEDLGTVFSDAGQSAVDFGGDVNGALTSLSNFVNGGGSLDYGWLDTIGEKFDGLVGKIQGAIDVLGQWLGLTGGAPEKPSVVTDEDFYDENGMTRDEAKHGLGTPVASPGPRPQPSGAPLFTPGSAGLGAGLLSGKDQSGLSSANGGMFAGMVAAAKTAATEIQSAISTMKIGVVSDVNDTANTTIATFGAWQTALTAIIPPIDLSVRTAISTMKIGVVTDVQDTVNTTIAVFGGWQIGLIAIASALDLAVRTAISTTKIGVVADVNDLVATTIAVAGAWQTGIVAIATTLDASVRAVMSTMKIGVVADVNDAVNTTLGVFGGWQTGMVAIARGLDASVRGAMSTMKIGSVSDIRDLVNTGIAEFGRLGSEGAGTINNSAGAVASAAYNMGSMASLGVSNGINAYLGDVTTAVNNIVAEVDRALAAGLRTGSPSRLTAWYGRMTTLGLPKGMLREIPALRRAARRIVAEVSAGLAPVAFAAPTIDTRFVGAASTALSSDAKQLTDIAYMRAEATALQRALNQQYSRSSVLTRQNGDAVDRMVTRIGQIARELGARVSSSFGLIGGKLPEVTTPTPTVPTPTVPALPTPPVIVIPAPTSPVRPPRVPPAPMPSVPITPVRPPRIPNPANIVPADQQTYGNRPPRPQPAPQVIQTFHVTIDAKNVKDFNDVVSATQGLERATSVVVGSGTGSARPARVR